METRVRVKKIVLGLLLSVLLVLLFSWIGNEVVFKNRGVTSDFYFFWFGGRSLLEHKYLYSAEATNEIQEFVFSGPLEPGEYSRPFPYPAFFALLFLPFGVFSYPAALSIWLSLQFPILFVALYLFKKFLNLELPNWELGLLFVAGSIGFFYAVISYTLGQLSILILFLFVTAFYFLQIGRPVWAGVILSLIAVRPDMFLVGCIACGVIAWDSKKDLITAAISTLVSFLVMNLLTIFLMGLWYADWLEILAYYSSHNPHTRWPLDILPNAGTKISLVVILFAYLLWQARQSLIAPTQRNKISVLSILIPVYMIVTTMTGSYHMTLLLIPLLILLQMYSRYNLRWVIWIMFFVPWIYWLTLARTYPWSAQLLFPLSLLVLQAVFVFTDRRHQVAEKDVQPV